MYTLLWLIPILPLAGFLIITLFSGFDIHHRWVSYVGVGSVGLSALITLLLGINFIIAPPANNVFIQKYWTWMSVAGFSPNMAFHLDALSLLMTFVITFVGFMIHLYSSEFMQGDEGYDRFFSYMNLFVGMMLILVLADNLLLLYLGWEGVGLCSYLLIGFWYRNPKNGRAARKAFIVTRVGDTAMAIGLFLLLDRLGTLQIQEVLQQAVKLWPVGSGLAVAAAALLMGGALGKSAQLPLQIWLPDAMAGPTPVSALIHAATMVTAGVYLIARLYALFELAPVVMHTIAILGAITLILAGFSALVQEDIKRVLAYSTMSQIGYMFLALGVGAWSAAMFHFMSPAFFKALLFLGAGVIIIRLHHEHDMFRMGGLRKDLPLTFWTFLIGSASLSALPLITAGFFSKDKILWDVWSSPMGGSALWAAGLFGALLTSMYTFRMVFLTFFREPHSLVVEHRPIPKPGWRMQIPLVVLAGLSIIGGYIELPDTLGGFSPLSDLLHRTLPELIAPSGNLSIQWILQGLAVLVSLVGIYLAYFFILRKPEITHEITHSPVGRWWYRFWYLGWGFDWMDNEFIVQPFVWIARKDKQDWVDHIFTGIARLTQNGWQFLSGLQTGRVRYYALSILVGAIIVISLAVFL